jgi:phenylacetate-CoA ligase
MHAVKRWATWTKRTVIGDAFIRRMPFWYRPPLQVFEQLARAPLAERKAWSLQRLERVLQAAQETEYGRQIGRARAITDWPLLEKDLVRESPARFLRTPQWRTVPASTSGTTGLPLKLFRSYASIGAEQAAIDWLYFARGYDPRKLRFAVLRGENIKPPSDRTPPFWRWDANGRRLVLSSNHLKRGYY